MKDICLIKIFETGPLYGLLCVYGLWLNLFHRNGPMYVLFHRYGLLEREDYLESYTHTGCGVRPQELSLTGGLVIMHADGSSQFLRNAD